MPRALGHRVVLHAPEPRVHVPALDSVIPDEFTPIGRHGPIMDPDGSMSAMWRALEALSSKQAKLEATVWKVRDDVMQEVEHLRLSMSETAHIPQTPRLDSPSQHAELEITVCKLRDDVMQDLEHLRKRLDDAEVLDAVGRWSHRPLRTPRTPRQVGLHLQPSGGDEEGIDALGQWWTQSPPEARHDAEKGAGGKICPDDEEKLEELERLRVKALEVARTPKVDLPRVQSIDESAEVNEAGWSQRTSDENDATEKGAEGKMRLDDREKFEELEHSHMSVAEAAVTPKVDSTHVQSSVDDEDIIFALGRWSQRDRGEKHGVEKGAEGHIRFEDEETLQEEGEVSAILGTSAQVITPPTSFIAMCDSRKPGEAQDDGRSPRSSPSRSPNPSVHSQARQHASRIEASAPPAPGTVIRGNGSCGHVSGRDEADTLPSRPGGESRPFCSELVVPPRCGCVLVVPVFAPAGTFRICDVNGKAVLHATTKTSGLGAPWQLVLQTADGDSLAHCREGRYSVRSAAMGESPAEFQVSDSEDEYFASLVQLQEQRYELWTTGGFKLCFQGDLLTEAVSVTDFNGDQVAMTEPCGADVGSPGSHYRLRVAPLANVGHSLCALLCIGQTLRPRA